MFFLEIKVRCKLINVFFFFFLFIEPSNVIEVEGKGIKKWTVPKAFGMKTRHEEYLSSALIPTSLANGNGSVQKV